MLVFIEFSIKIFKNYKMNVFFVYTNRPLHYMKRKRHHEKQCVKNFDDWHLGASTKRLAKIVIWHIYVVNDL